MTVNRERVLTDTGIDSRHLMERLLTTREAGCVQRYHTARVTAQSVADHTYGVINLILVLSEGTPSVELLKAALWHDAAESVTGDLPAPFKRLDPVLTKRLTIMEDKFLYDTGLDAAISSEELVVLKWADILELIMYCGEQTLVGNLYARQIMDTGISMAKQLPHLITGKLMLNRITEYFGSRGIDVC